MKVTPKKAYELIQNHKGEFFHVVFIKKDGTLRKMTCRTGVKKYLRGGSLSYDPSKVLNVPVYDMEAKGYRTVKCSSIKSLSLSGDTYEVSDE